MNKGNIVIFLAGAVIGGIFTYIAVKDYYRAKADVEIEQVRDAYRERLDNIEKPKSSADGEIVGPEVINEKVHLDKTKASYARDLNNKMPLKDYTKYFKEKDDTVLDLKEVTKDALSDSKGVIIEQGHITPPDGHVAPDDLEIDIAELEHPEDDEPYTDKQDFEETMRYEDEILNGAHKRAIAEGRGPYVIDASDFELTCANYDKISLCYYIYDDVLIDDSGLTPEEVNRFDIVGDLIMESGFNGNDEEILYVRNDILMVDYEITKVFTNFI